MASTLSEMHLAVEGDAMVTTLADTDEVMSERDLVYVNRPCHVALLMLMQMLMLRERGPERTAI